MEKEKQRWYKKSYWGIVQGEKFLGHFFLLIIRLYWGGLLIVTGLGKWMHIHSVAEHFSAWGISFPFYMAALVGSMEILGGISLFIGLFARVFTVALATIFVVAYATAHKSVLPDFFTNPSQVIAQEPFLYLYTTLVVLCFGSGFFSFDYWIEKRFYGKAL